jgi:hypothetical protein
MMHSRVCSAIGLLAFCGVAGLVPAASAGITIDDWSVDQGPFTFTSNPASNTANGSMLFGNRRIGGGVSDGRGRDGVIAGVSQGVLSGTYQAGKYADLYVQWGSFGGPAIDLSEGGLNDRLRFSSVNLPELRIYAFNAADNYFLYYSATEVSGTDVDISFDSFMYSDLTTFESRAATAADFAAVERVELSLYVSQGSVFSEDRAFSAGTFAAVPAPSAAALMGLASLGALRRRR